MALLSDVPVVLRSYGFFGFLRRVWEEMLDDEIFTWASALAYSWLFALFPFLIFLMTLLPYMPVDTREAAHGEIKNLVFDWFPDQAADVIWTNIDRSVDNLLNNKQGKLVPRLLGLGLALWAASGGMSMTLTSLDMCYEVHVGRPFYIQRPFAVGMTILVAGLMLSVVCLLPIGSIAKEWAQTRYPPLRGSFLLILFDIVRWPLAIFFLIAALSIIYQKGPSIRRRWTWLTPGGVFCVLVWLGLGLLFRLYITKYGTFSQTYGTIGGVVVLLLFFYIDAVVLLVGAEINSEIDFKVLGVDRGCRDFRAAEAVCRPRRRKKNALAGVVHSAKSEEETQTAKPLNIPAPMPARSGEDE